MSRHEVTHAVDELKNRIAQLATSPPTDPRTGEPLAALCRHSEPQGSYRVLGERFLRSVRAIDAGSARTEALRALLLHGVVDFIEDGRLDDCNRHVRLFTLRNFDRIVTQAALEDRSRYDIDNDRYLKDLAIVTGTMFPVGCYFVERAGIPRSILYRGGIRQGVRFLGMLARGSGTDDFLVPHMNNDDLAFFNERGEEHFYRICAEVADRDPSVRGIARLSWLMDPALAEFGRNLVHLVETPLHNGAERFFFEADADGTSGALTFSPVRRKAFDEGRYVPAAYLLVWPRRALLDWYRRASEPASTDPALVQWSKKPRRSDRG